MEKLFLSLKNILNSTDPEAMDDMTVEEECVIFFLKKYFELRGSTVHHVHNIQVTDGPNYGPVSTNVSLRFEAVSTNPDGEDKEIMSVFLKMPPMLPMSLDRVFQTELCFYSSLLPDMLDYFRHPIKGEYLPPLPSSVFIHTDLEDQVYTGCPTKRDNVIFT
ncbi:uncharacterized protein LOC111713716 [Eurytemora carolleeae]|uniref:uncharacterized protein LOC111713716 n=1 Tax=Eurytemora carolleeae TaxID=1294199 RepID=UPI000C758BDF|nr:uncharacterized protein LOC111713716 [Eurytemora carolleeae]|eukprot:XP_023344419.1 uncharacterized protein LOC111713716 [Eurytemora affinis]